MANSEKDRSNEPVKVTDRRAFTPDGEKRSPDPVQDPVTESKAPPVAGEGFTMSPGPMEELGIAPLVVWLSQIAYINLGGVEDPVTRNLEVNLESARQMIDFLDVLRVKTRGNLTPIEERLFAGVYELKLLYAEKSAAP